MSRKTEKSDELYSRACELMPGGVSSPVRAFRSVGGSPVYFKRANGARIEDADGNEYVDFCMSWGPLILGHAHPDVIAAVRQAAYDGLSYGACCESEIHLAELILEAEHKMDQVRFVSSGTEAVMTAIRLARGVTDRPRILKFEGGYHGHSDSLLVKAGSGLATFGTSSSLGVPESFAKETMVCALDDEEALKDVFYHFGSELAAAIVEPLPANNGLLEQRPEWLRLLRELCDRHGVLLIFDEVISGFRTRFGTYSDTLGVAADLLTLGKIIGGGMPVGAVVGPRSIMEELAPLGGVYQAGTLSGNPVSLAAGIATLQALKDPAVYEHLEALGSRLDKVLQSVKDELGYVSWRRVGSIVWLYLTEGVIPRAASFIDPVIVKRFNSIYSRLLDKGLYLPPSAYEVMFLSNAHTEDDVERLGSELHEALRGVDA